MRRCTNDLKALLKEDDNQVRVHWLWNRVIAMLLAALGTFSVLMAEPLMGTPLVLGLREIFFQYPWDRSDDVMNRGSPRSVDNGKSAAGACNQLYQSLLVTSLLSAWLHLLGERGETRAGRTQVSNLPAQLLEATDPVLDNSSDMLGLVVHQCA